MDSKMLTQNKTKSVFGIGINDSNYKVSVENNGKWVKCVFYEKWKSMLERCYSKKRLKKYPSYIGCSVCDEWLSFMAFRSWMILQDWEGNALDKDIIKPGNKVYSPDACCFVSQSINNLINMNIAKRGDLPLGVSWDNWTNKYISYMKIDGKFKNLGRFDTACEAHITYCVKKSAHIKNIALLQDDPIRTGLLHHAKIIEQRRLK